MKCPYCQATESSVVDTTKDFNHGFIRRRRECDVCHQRYSTIERPIMTTPLLVKRDGTREEFDREKLLAGRRTACAKRPVSADALNNLVNEIESELQKRGRSEINSRVIGDLAIKGLLKLDHIAYIRYASVYLRMDDLHAIRDEIDHLLSEEEK